MEVHFPISNYTFPRPEILHESRKVDQIYIPAKALQTNRGKFSLCLVKFIEIHKETQTKYVHRIKILSWFT